jgi:hypothetical protein
VQNILKSTSHQNNGVNIRNYSQDLVNELVTIGSNSPLTKLHNDVSEEEKIALHELYTLSEDQNESKPASDSFALPAIKQSERIDSKVSASAESMEDVDGENEDALVEISTAAGDDQTASSTSQKSDKKYDNIISDFQTHSRKSFSFLVSKSSFDGKFVKDKDDSLLKSDNVISEENSSSTEVITSEKDLPQSEPLQTINEEASINQGNEISPVKVKQQENLSPIKTESARPTMRAKSFLKVSKKPSFIVPLKQLNIPFKFLSNVQENQRKTIFEYYLLSIEENVVNLRDLQFTHGVYYDVEAVADCFLPAPSSSSSPSKLNKKRNFLGAAASATAPIPLHELHLSYQEIVSFYYTVCMKNSASCKKIPLPPLSFLTNFVSDSYVNNVEKMNLLKVLKKLEKSMTNYLMKITEKVQNLYENQESFLQSSNSFVEKHFSNFYNFSFENSMKTLNYLDFVNFFHHPENLLNEKIANLVPSLLPNNTNNKGGNEGINSNTLGSPVAPGSGTPSSKFKWGLNTRLSQANVFANIRSSFLQTNDSAFPLNNTNNNAEGVLETVRKQQKEEELPPTITVTVVPTFTNYQYIQGKEQFQEFKFGTWQSKLEKKYEKLISLQTHYMESIHVKKQAHKMLKKHVKRQLKKMKELSDELEDIGYNALDLTAEIDIDKNYPSESDDESQQQHDNILASGDDRKNEKKNGNGEEEADEILLYDNKFLISDDKEERKVIVDSKRSGSRSRKEAKDFADEVLSDVSLDEFENNSQRKETEKSGSIDLDKIVGEKDQKVSAKQSPAHHQNLEVHIDNYQRGRIRPTSAKADFSRSRNHYKDANALNPEPQKRGRPRTANSVGRGQPSEKSSESPSKMKRPISPYLLPPFKVDELDLSKNIYLVDERRDMNFLQKKKYSHAHPKYAGDFTNYEKDLLKQTKSETNFHEKLKQINDKSHAKQHHIYRGVNLAYKKNQILFNSNLIPEEEKQRMYKDQYFLNLKNKEYDETVPFIFDPNAEDDGNLMAANKYDSSFKAVRMSVREMRSALKRGYTLSSLLTDKSPNENAALSRSKSNDSRSPSPKALAIENPIRDKTSPLDKATIERLENRRQSVKPVANSLYAIQNIPKYEKKQMFNMESIHPKDMKEISDYYKLGGTGGEEVGENNEFQEEKGQHSEQILQNLFHHSAKPSKIAMTKDMINLYGFSPKKAMQIFGPIPSYNHEKHGKKQGTVVTKKKKSSGINQSSLKDGKNATKSLNSKSSFSLQKSASRVSDNDEELHEILFGKGKKKSAGRKNLQKVHGSESKMLTSEGASQQPPNESPVLGQTITVAPFSNTDHYDLIENTTETKSPSASPTKQVKWEPRDELPYDDDNKYEQDQEEFVKNEEINEEQNYFAMQNVSADSFDEPHSGTRQKEESAKKKQSKAMKNNKRDHETDEASKNRDSKIKEEKQTGAPVNLEFLKENTAKLMEAILSLLQTRGLIFPDDDEIKESDEGKSLQDELKEHEAFQRVYEKYDTKLSKFHRIIAKQKEKIEQQWQQQQQLLQQSVAPKQKRASFLSMMSTISSVAESFTPLSDVEYNEMQTELQEMSDLIFALIPDLISLLNTFIIEPYLAVLFSKDFLLNEMKFDLIIFFIKKCLNYTKLADNGILTIPLDRTMQYSNPVALDENLVSSGINHSIDHDNVLRKSKSSSRPSSAVKTTKKTHNSLLDISLNPLNTEDENLHEKETKTEVLFPYEYHDNFLSNNTITNSGLYKAPFSPTNPQKHFVMTTNWDENSDKIRELLYYDVSSKCKTSQLTKDITSSNKTLETWIPHDSHHDYQYQLHANNLTFHPKPFRTGSNPYSGYHPLGFHNKYSSVYHTQDLYDHDTSNYYEELIEKKNRSLEYSKARNESRFKVTNYQNYQPVLSQHQTQQHSSGKGRGRSLSPELKGIDEEGKEREQKPSANEERHRLQDILVPEKHNKTLEEYLKSPKPVVTMSFKQQQHDNLMLLNKNPAYLDNKINNYFYLVHNVQKQIYQMLFNNLELQFISSLFSFQILLFHEFYYFLYQQYSQLIQENIVKGKKGIYPKTVEEVLSSLNFQIFFEQKEIFFQKLFANKENSIFEKMKEKIHALLTEKYSLQLQYFNESIEKLEEVIVENLSLAKNYTDLIHEKR